MPGHRREGSGAATTWAVDADRYHAFYTQAPRLVAVAPPISDDDAIAKQALEAAGLRKAG